MRESELEETDLVALAGQTDAEGWSAVKKEGFVVERAGHYWIRVVDVEDVDGRAYFRVHSLPAAWRVECRRQIALAE